ncbi:MAG: hypothetical protein AAF433_16960 [Bacteroidota bacterium]
MRKNYQLGIVILTATFLVVLLFRSWLPHLNSRVIEPWGDGYKAYHAILYHAEYDESVNWYQGMNYPYGEHAVPGATQPLISTSIRVLDALGLPASEHGLAIVHLSLLLGMILCLVFSFLILERLGADWTYALLAAAAITLLAPQIDRFASHYGLAHLEVLPVIIYGLLRWSEKQDWRWSLAIAGATMAFALIHFYFFAILAFTIGGFLGCHWLLSRDWASWKQQLWHLFLMFGIPVILLFGWINLTDPVSDRNDAPWGFFHYNAHPGTVLSSPTMPHGRWLQKQVFGQAPYNIEAWSYFGLIAIAFMLFVVGRWAYSRFQRPPVPRTQQHQLFLHSLLLSSFLVLLFSFGLPFTKIGGEQLLEKTGPLRQFRSVGRFAWLAYFAFNFAAFAALGRRVTQGKYWLPLLGLAFISYEAVHFWKGKNFELDLLGETVEGQRYIDLENIDFSRYQAILPIPYFNIGSDNFWWAQNGAVGQKSLILSQQTGLPMTAGMLTRTSLSETLKQLQLHSEPYRVPALLEDLPDERPFLLVVDVNRWRDFADVRDHFLAGQEPLHQQAEFLFYELPVEVLRQRPGLKARQIRAQMQQDSLWEQGPWLVDDSTEFYSQDFGADRYEGDLGEENILFDQQDLELTPGEYDLSFWVDLSQDRSARTGFRIETKKPDGTAGPQFGDELHRHTAVFDDEGWTQISYRFRIEENIQGIRLSLQMPLLKGRPLIADDVFLQPVGMNIYRLIDETLFHNGRYYPPDLNR